MALVECSTRGRSARVEACARVDVGSKISTARYRAPENALRSPVYSSPADVWAAGAVLAELVNGGRPLFPASSEVDLVHRVFHLRGNPWSVGWAEGCRLATKLRLKPREESCRRREPPKLARAVAAFGAKLDAPRGDRWRPALDFAERLLQLRR